jgi:hypothetical protein
MRASQLAPKESLVFALAAAALVAAPALRAQGAILAERPELRIGDSWTYVVTESLSKRSGKVTVEVRSKEPQWYVVRRTAEFDGPPTTESRRRSFDLNALATVNGQQSDSGTLQFPLVQGKAWTVKSELWRSEYGYGYRDMTYSVVGKERITVPAGTFDTIRIKGEGRTVNEQLRMSDQTSRSLWYAPAIRAVIRGEWKNWWGGTVAFEGSEELSSVRLVDGDAITTSGNAESGAAGTTTK